MKKALLILLSALMILSLVSCGAAGSDTEKATEKTTEKAAGTVSDGDETDLPYHPSTADTDEEETQAQTSNAPELAVTRPEDLVCEKNKKFVARYNVAHNDNDAVFVEDYGESSVYYVWNGFHEDGSINQISGYTCLYYFFADQASYQTALASVSGSSLRKKNDDCLYFTVRTAVPDDDTYDDMMATFSKGEDYRHPNFIPVVK